MKHITVLIAIVVTIALPTISVAQSPPPAKVTVKPTDSDSSRIEFFIAMTLKGDSQFSATIRDTGEKVYFVEMINVDRADISQIIATKDSNDQPAIKLTFKNAAKRNMATITGKNIGKRLAICIDDEVISAPTIQSAISGEAIITGKFTSEEVDEMVNRLSPPSFRSQLVFIKSDWSQVGGAENLTADLREALEGASVPDSLIAKLPTSGPDILFPPDIVSCYKPEHYVELLAWLRANNLLVSITSFPTPNPERIPVAPAARQLVGSLAPHHKTSLTQPVDNYGAGSLFREFETNKLFVTYKAVIQWRLTLLGSSPKPRLRVERETLLQEHKRGQPPNEQRQIDVSAHETTLPRNHVWIMNAFPGDADSVYRSVAKQDDVIPLVISWLDSVSHPETAANDDGQVRIPDFVESIVVNHVSTHPRLRADTPEADVSFKIIGAVKNPGMYQEFDEGIRMLDTIAVAGGLTNEASDQVTIIRKTDDDQEPVVVEISIEKAKHDSRRNMQIVAGDVIAVEGGEEQNEPDNRLLEVFVLKNTDAESLAKTLSQLVHDDVAVAADQKENRLLVHASRKRLNEIKSLVTQIETAPTSSEQSSAKSEPPEATTVEQLRRKYQASEEAAFSAAAAARRDEKDGRRPRRAPQNITELKRIVADSYAIRRALHQAEVAQLEQRAKKIRESMAHRDRIADQIIDRRVEDLLDPSLRWESDSNATAKSTSKPSSASSSKRNNELSAYRTFLWDSLGPLLSTRNDRLSDITSVEQSLVDLEGTIEIPQDADPATKKRLEQEKQRVQNRIASLKESLKTLRKELDPVERQIALLKQKLTDSSSDQVAIEGKITALADDRVFLSIGANDGISIGNKLPVFRDEKVIGNVEIVEIQSNTSVARILAEDSHASVRLGDRAKMLLDAQTAQLIGQDPGESIYNDHLKRFKFKLEKIDVTSSAEMAAEFSVRYRGRGYPPITGVWSDPRTNSLIIVGPPEADQPIRDTIAEWEGLQTGVEYQDQYSLEAQFEQLQRRRKSILEQIASRKLEIIDAEVQGEKADGDQLVELNRRLKSDLAELELTDRTLQVISDSINQLNGDVGNLEATAVDEADRSSRIAIRDKLRQRLDYLEAIYRAGRTTLSELLSAANKYADAAVHAADTNDAEQAAWRKHAEWLGRLKDQTVERRDAGVASVGDLLAVEVELLRAEVHVRDDTAPNLNSRPEETASTPEPAARNVDTTSDQSKERYRQIVNELSALRVQEQELLAKYVRDHPLVKEVQLRLAAAITTQARLLGSFEATHVAAEADYNTAQQAAKLAALDGRPEAELKELQAQVQKAAARLTRITEVLEFAKQLATSLVGNDAVAEPTKNL